MKKYIIGAIWVVPLCRAALASRPSAGAIPGSCGMRTFLSITVMLKNEDKWLL